MAITCKTCSAVAPSVAWWLSIAVTQDPDSGTTEVYSFLEIVIILPIDVEPLV